MSRGPSEPYSLLTTFSRLREAVSQIQAEREGKPPLSDPLLKSDPTALPYARAGSRTARMDSINIRLHDLVQKLHDAHNESVPGPPPNHAAKNNQAQPDLLFRLRVVAHVEGLVITNQQSAETDRYLLSFIDGNAFRITDKWAGKSTTFWGDPPGYPTDYLDHSKRIFPGLMEPDTQITLLLQDGSRLTFTVHDRGVMERVDIFLGNQHAEGIGAGSPAWSVENMFFCTPVRDNGTTDPIALAIGNIVHAGGDGADWYDNAGRLIWGETTGSSVLPHPATGIGIESQTQRKHPLLDRTF